jgi:hypothetical protein
MPSVRQSGERFIDMRQLVALAILTWAALVRADAQSCAALDTLTVEGELLRRTFPGPPNYESVASGDSPETVWILLLDRSMCFRAPGTEPATVEVQQDVLLLQLILPSPPAASQRLRERQRVSIRALPFFAETGHHHTPVMLQVLRLRPLNQSKSP